MKVIIPENRLEQLIFKYLDVKFKDLEQSRGEYYDIVFRFPDEEYGIMGWNRPDTLSIYRKLIDNIFSFIPIEKTEIQMIIGRYVESRYNLEVIYTKMPLVYFLDQLKVDTIWK
jgi:hypothetical protein